MLDLFEEPGISETAASDENAVCAGDVHRFTGKFWRDDIAIHEKGEMGDVFACFTDAMPVGFTGIALFARAAVHGNKIGAGVGYDFYEFQAVGVLNPAQTCFYRDRNWDGSFHFADDLCGAIRFFDECGAVEVGDEVVDGAAHVDVEGIGFEAVVNDAGGFSHRVRIGTEDLLDKGALALVKAGHLEGLWIKTYDGFRAHHLAEH